MLVRAAIFDCDGVVLNSFPSAMRAIEFILKKRHNIDVKSESEKWRLTKAKANWGMSGSETIKIICPEETEIYGFWNDWWEFEQANAYRIKLINNIEKMVKDLRNMKIKIVLATNRNAHTLQFYTKTSELNLNYFDIIQTYEKPSNPFSGYILDHAHHIKNVYPKPHIKSLEWILTALRSKYGVAKEEIIFLGDTNVDYLAGKQNNICFVGVANHGPAEGDKKYFTDKGVLPECIIGTTSEIIDWIKNKNITK